MKRTSLPLRSRSNFIWSVGGAALALSLPARAQPQAKMPHIGVIDDSPIWNAFRRAALDTGSARLLT
jgi:hypothetical protein